MFDSEQIGPFSWGRVQRYKQQVKRLNWLDEAHADFSKIEVPVLAYGLGRSYGDCCLNENGLILDTHGLKRFISFDDSTGILRCEAGASLAEIINVFLPRGWFPPVVPGTKFVTVGGAIANDIHGKNHHSAGTFGRHVIGFELVRSEGGAVYCSAEKNQELYRATIGGMGLTGLITWVDVRLKRVESPYLFFENIKMDSLNDFFSLSRESDQNYEYTVAWVDSTATGQSLGRGIFMRGRHESGHKNILTRFTLDHRDVYTLPWAPPFNLMSRNVAKVLNNLYYSKQRKKHVRGQVIYNSYFFPLDKIGNWNLVFGRKGFYQYQFVVPLGEEEAIRDVLTRAARSVSASFVTVLKKFGSVESPGMMSFPMGGYTLTLDCPNYGRRTMEMFQDFERIVAAAGGRIYAAKDSVMSADFFAQSNPNLSEFKKWIDPKFSSSLWRRVNDYE